MSLSQSRIADDSAESAALAKSKGASPISSNFSSDADGWIVAGSGNSGAWHQSGGHPGGYLATAGSGTTSASCLAPEKFIGNDKAYYGGTLSYDCEDAHSDGKASKLPGLVLYDGVHTLFGFASAPVGKDWTHETIKLEAGHLYDYAGDADAMTKASKSEIKAVLANLTLLEVVQPFTGGGKDTGGIDNVVLAAAKGGSHGLPADALPHGFDHPAFTLPHGLEHLALA